MGRDGCGEGSEAPRAAFSNSRTGRSKPGHRVQNKLRQPNLNYAIRWERRVSGGEACGVKNPPKRGGEGKKEIH